MCTTFTPIPGLGVQTGGEPVSGEAVSGICRYFLLPKIETMALTFILLMDLNLFQT